MSSVLYYALPALGSYAVLSIFFLRRPRLLHTPGVPAFRPRLGAHRGGSGERLENTMEAMENAMAQRSDLLELDCQLTRDGVVVVSHDENLSRQSGVNKDVGSLDFEELPLYKEELEVYFSPGHFARGSDRHMVRLEDVFQRFPRMPVSVEVKEENEKLIHKIASLVRHFDRNDITIWASEKSSIMKKCKAANPEMPLSFTRCRVIRLLLLYYLGLLPFVPIPERFLLCFLPTIINRTYFPFSCSGLNKLTAMVTKWLIMRKSLIQHLEQRGVQALGSLCSPWAAPRVGPLPLAPAMVRISKPKTFQAYLDDCHRRYSCAHCRAHLANHDDLISKSFQGSQGRAYLFNSVVNVGCGPAEERVLLTGLHAVADIHCENCKTTLGWKYEQAFESSQKYKEGKYIIELNHMIKDNGWD
ncbi:Glycerophosphodiester phosphodiesterase domain-containing protein 3 [Myotis davidii]|uniref:Lysophospholipase D GDPD3 n=1 Tax=Myotis davidii TaxID=225400 RepID=L5M909_MYODS|nr:Glycerophosphodiester phosphodiesterase domain-containing protein 3 [Myotis davidii]